MEWLKEAKSSIMKYSISLDKCFSLKFSTKSKLSEKINVYISSLNIDIETNVI